MAKINIADLTITSIETITAFDIHTGAYRFMLDELQNASINQTQEDVDITGRGGRKITRLKRNKSVTVSGTNGLLSGGLLEAQTGSKFENGTMDVMWTDYLTVKSNKATTNYKAVGTAGAEIVSVNVKNDDGTIESTLQQAATTADGKFAYAPATKELTFTGVADGTEVVVRYKRKMQANRLSNRNDKYSEKLQLYIDALAEDKASNVYRVQYYIPKADFKGEFSTEMGENQAVHAFEAESMVGSDRNAALWSYTIFGANEADAA